MKTNLLICFLSFAILAFGKEEREIIKHIDDINASAIQYYNENNLVKSYEGFVKARTLSDSIQDHYGYAVASFNLGNIYSLVENYQTAEESYLLAIQSLNELNDNVLMAEVYHHLAKIYKDKKEYDTAIPYFEKALGFALQENNFVQADKAKINGLVFNIRLNLCELYIDRNSLNLALMGLLNVKDYLEVESLDPSSQAYFNYVNGLYNARKELFNQAQSNFNKAISLLDDNNEDHLGLLSNVYMQQSIAQAKSGNSTQAYLSLLDHNKIKEKFLSRKEQQQDAITKARLQIEEYKNNASLANMERLQQLEITNKVKKINVIIMIATVMLLIFLIIIYIGYVSKRKLTQTLKIKNTELEAAKNEALKSSELKTKFISNVTHELRTPLYGVVGITSLLLDNSNLNNRDRKYLKSLKYSGDYLLNLINDILQVGKMESNKVELQNVSVDLKSMLEDISNSFDYRLVETNNKIKVFVDEHVPERIMCDNVRLSQILINLIGNSIKFTSNGVINLRVSLTSLDDEKVGLRFEIEDNGIGIPKDKFDAIFETFSQLKDSNVNYQGTGLGLSITKNLITLFNSKIDLKSKEGVGTTFSFEVDFDIDKSKAIEEKEALDNKIEKPKEKYEILVAEDNKINQVVTKNLLEKQGYGCTIVKNGKEAFEAVSRKKYDLVLMDINMPIMNGNEATEAIREFNKTIPIIALTAADLEEIKQMYASIGYNDVVIKPFDNYEFFQVISTHIQNSRRGNLKLIKAS
ncbi:ATP-binding protein [Tamlana crocina]|uniref:histidine kinase n=1 Tax=Tamlana crocina TaxID=393006 RepID=A0ABX1D8E5_9FLAO|nr:ATP-binding protein [Tamlana crocina]NJX14540.1 response regulator [Tamlana crocina]